ncbi:MAG: hypothetical protein IKQ55_06430 [Kiritimatiellae bacterium]|nr:hypothetical protein [Kiritimatiellia bacterium]
MTHRRLHWPAPAVAALAAFLAAATAVPAADPPATQMTIGVGEAWVRLHFPPSGRAELTSLRWPDPPDGLDPSTIRVWTPKRPAPLEEWRWRDDSPAAPSAPDAPVVWQPNPAPSTSPAVPRALELLLASPLSDAMGHSLTFRLSGFSWAAHYHMTVRGLGASSLKQAQIDLSGTVRIQNGTATAWPGVRLSFAGSLDPAPPAAPKPFGLVALDRDSPLTAPWFPAPPAEPDVPGHWPLRIPADLAAGSPTEIPFLHTERKPARVVHAYDSDRVPLPTPAAGVPLDRWILIPNTPEMGLGHPLLPGPLDWTMATRSPRPAVHTVTLAHTPFPGTLRVPLGPVDGLRTARAALPPEDLPDGTRLVDCTIRFTNDLDGEADIEATERPPVPAWNLVSSSIPCTATDETLLFSFSLPPRASKTLTYRIRLPASR